MVKWAPTKPEARTLGPIPPQLSSSSSTLLQNIERELSLPSRSVNKNRDGVWGRGVGGVCVGGGEGGTTLPHAQW